MLETSLVERLAARVQKPGRYVGGEWNAVWKDPVAVHATAALAIPDVYEVGMASPVLHKLQAYVNRDEHLLAERVPGNGGGDGARRHQTCG